MNVARCPERSDTIYSLFTSFTNTKELEMIGKTLDTLIKPAAKVFDRNSMSIFGVNNTMAVARAYNRLRFGQFHEYRLRNYREHFSELIEENGKPVAPVNEMKDGWVIDTSGNLPYLEELIRESEEIISELGGIRHESRWRPFFQDLIREEHFARFPSILNFATSSDVLSTICSYLGLIPVLSYSKPYGVRLVESWKKFDSTPDAPPRDSQLFHLDFHDAPMAYAIVLLRDVTMKRGPFCFLPASASKKAYDSLGDYHSKKGGHRVTDERMYSHVSESELIKMCYPAGTVLFLDNSACFHYGSRDAIEPRHLMMFAYVSPCRTDFGDIVLKQMRFPASKGDSRLRRMLIDREYVWNE